MWGGHPLRRSVAPGYTKIRAFPNSGRSSTAPQDRQNFAQLLRPQVWPQPQLYPPNTGRVRIPVKKATHSGNKKPPGSGPAL